MRPSGLSPVSFSERAQQVIATRTTPVQSWYFDLNLIGRYFGGERVYHHTAPVNMIFALHEALRAGLESLGLALPVDESMRLPPLTLVRIPDGVDDRAVRANLLAEHRLEIGGGLGDFKGKAWRIGLMSASATPHQVELCIGVLREALGCGRLRHCQTTTIPGSIQSRAAKGRIAYAN